MKITMLFRVDSVRNRGTRDLCPGKIVNAIWLARYKISPKSSNEIGQNKFNER